jgi:hypothetical protein
MNDFDLIINTTFAITNDRVITVISCLILKLLLRIDKLEVNALH